MKNHFARHLWTVLICASCWWLSSATLHSQTTGASEVSAQDSEDKDQCIRNLKLIFDAIQAYRADHKDIPNWLSDLVPQYITDANVLVCPVCKRTGQTETSPFADPKISSSYLYQFCPVPLGKTDTAAGSGKTCRELNFQLMSVTGPMVPLVRCWHHNQVLNLSYDGKIYESGAQWLDKVSGTNTPAGLGAGKAAASDAPSANILQHSSVMVIPPRDAKAGANLLDLSDFYNAGLTQSWLGGVGDDFSALPSGLQTFGGHQFDVRGIVQLRGSLAVTLKFPKQARGIKLHQKCERLHFLNAAAFGGVEDNGHQIGSYIVHYASNQMQLEIPLHYGTDLRNWHMRTENRPKIAKSIEIWTGTNPACQAAGKSIRLFLTTWVNAAPGVEIESIDFVSNGDKSAPFLVAITAE